MTQNSRNSPKNSLYDLAIIGGGVNGTAIARDAAGRGLSVLLIEADDLASGTSSASSKLIHGGLRYLEYMEFRLVREALKEREVQLGLAPHIIWPVRIVLPHHQALRPRWMLRMGLFLYDHLGGRQELPGTQSVTLTNGEYAHILKSNFTHGFAFSDCWVDDARLVICNAMDAAQHGADICRNLRCAALNRTPFPDDKALHCWRIDMDGQNRRKGEQHVAHARAIVNAAGVHVDQILGQAVPHEDAENLRLIKGSHIIVPRIHKGEHLYMFQNPDDRIVFAIPYEQDFTLIGTTDAPYQLSEGKPKISAEETRYLLDSANRYFRRQLTAKDIVRSYSGVRPLYDDKASNASAITRDYVFDLDRGVDDNAPVILSIFGGKITTARKLAEHAMEQLLPCLLAGNADVNADSQTAEHRRLTHNWTAHSPLPGGDMPDGDFSRFFSNMSGKYPFIPAHQLYKIMRRHGTNALIFLGDAQHLDDLGAYFGADLYQCEVDYLLAHEWAEGAEDILWRRTKAELHMDDAQKARLADYLNGKNH